MIWRFIYNFWISKLRASTLCIGAWQATFLDRSETAFVVANLHTGLLDGSGTHSIPSAGRDTFLSTGLGNVLKGCATTPALRAEGVWVACGDTNMSIVAAAKVVKQVVQQSRDNIAICCSPDEKRDFIFSSAKLLKYRPRLFLARDQQHWAVAAHVTIGDLTDTSEGDIGAVSAATRDLQDAAKAAAIAHVAEQIQIAVAAQLRQQERDTDAEWAEIEQEALNETEQQQVIIDGPGFATRLHHWQFSKSFSVRAEVSDLQTCSWLCAAAPLGKGPMSVLQRQTFHSAATADFRNCSSSVRPRCERVSKC